MNQVPAFPIATDDKQALSDAADALEVVLDEAIGKKWKTLITADNLVARALGYDSIKQLRRTAMKLKGRRAPDNILSMEGVQVNLCGILRMRCQPFIGSVQHRLDALVWEAASLVAQTNFSWGETEISKFNRLMNNPFFTSANSAIYDFIPIDNDGGRLPGERTGMSIYGPFGDGAHWLQTVLGGKIAKGGENDFWLEQLEKDNAYYIHSAATANELRRRLLELLGCNETATLEQDAFALESYLWAFRRLQRVRESEPLNCAISALELLSEQTVYMAYSDSRYKACIGELEGIELCARMLVNEIGRLNCEKLPIEQVLDMICRAIGYPGYAMLCIAASGREGGGDGNILADPALAERICSAIKTQVPQLSERAMNAHGPSGTEVLLWRAAAECHFSLHGKDEALSKQFDDILKTIVPDEDTRHAVEQAVAQKNANVISINRNKLDQAFERISAINAEKQRAMGVHLARLLGHTNDNHATADGASSESGNWLGPSFASILLREAQRALGIYC